MDAKLNVVSLWTEDIRTTAHFYRDVIGLRLMPHHGEKPHFDLGGIYLVLVEGTPMLREEDLPEQFPVLAFSVNDLNEFIEKLRNNHVDLSSGIVEGAGTRWIMFNDPAGNLIELVELLS